MSKYLGGVYKILKVRPVYKAMGTGLFSNDPVSALMQARIKVAFFIDFCGGDFENRKTKCVETLVSPGEQELAAVENI